MRLLGHILDQITVHGCDTIWASELGGVCINSVDACFEFYCVMISGMELCFAFDDDIRRNA